MAQTRKTLVSVLVDDVMNLGALTYSIPAGMVCSVGDAVSVPFGKTSKHGLVKDQEWRVKPQLKIF
jgi:primosomal protein N'